MTTFKVVKILFLFFVGRQYVCCLKINYLMEIKRNKNMFYSITIDSTTH